MFYSLENEKLSVQVNDYGAELWSVYDKENKVEHLWQGEASIWPRRAPIVFPVCGEFVKGSYTVKGETYKMPIHGFGRDFVHTLVEQTATTLRLRLAADEKTKAIFPYDCVLDSVFTLEGNNLTHAFEVKNSGNEVLPFSVGYHTGYRCFHAPEEAMADCELQFDVAEPTILELDAARVANGLPSILSNDGKTVQIVPSLFTDSIILKDTKSTQITYYNRSTKRGVKIAATGFPTLVLWSADPEMAYLCIEPWHGEKETNADYGALENKPGFRLLPAGETFPCAQTITVLG